MQFSAARASKDYLTEEQQLRAVFCLNEPRNDTRLERSLYLVSVPALVLVLSLVAMDMLGLPSFGYLCELFLPHCEQIVRFTIFCADFVTRTALRLWIGIWADRPRH